MFRTLPDVEQAAARVAMPESVPLSVLSLDHPEPSGGWNVYLHERNIPIGEDDLGRPAIARVDARQLFAEQRKAEARRRELLARADEAAIEYDRQRRASIWKGLPADRLPVGARASEALLAAAHDTRPRR